MTDADWEYIHQILRVSTQHSNDWGISLVKLIFEYGKLLGEKNATTTKTN